MTPYANIPKREEKGTLKIERLARTRKLTHITLTLASLLSSACLRALASHHQPYLTSPVKHLSLPPCFFLFLYCLGSLSFPWPNLTEPCISYLFLLLGCLLLRHPCLLIYVFLKLPPPSASATHPPLLPPLLVVSIHLERNAIH